ncbi:MAG: outer membrane beta-barrel protein [Pseudomonadota bacterium]
MNKTSKLAAALAITTLGTAAAHAEHEGFYVGGAIDQSRFDSHKFDIDDTDKDDLGWKALAGFRFTPNFGAEAAYTNFGESNAPSVSVGGPFHANAHGFSAFGVGYLPVGPVDFFAKAGAAKIKAKGNVGAVDFDDDKTEFAYGAGLQWNLGHLGLRAEYEKFDTDVIGDLDIISVGFTFTFGP